MKYLIIVTVVFSMWLPARAEIDKKNPPNSPLEKAFAALTVAVKDSKTETVARRNAYNAAVKTAAEAKKAAETARAAADKKAADAAKLAESMKPAIAKATDIEKKTVAAHEALKKVTPVAPNSALARALTALTTAVADAKKATAAKQNAYNAALKKAGEVKKEAETAKAAAESKATAAAKQAEAMKVALTSAAYIEQKAQAALAGVKSAIEASR